ncbi:hypothetical protein ABBQ32_14139 [Trebouxia sp. C0010 RCD-2024]
MWAECVQQLLAASTTSCRLVECQFNWCLVLEKQLMQHATAIPSRTYPFVIPCLSVTTCKLVVPYDDSRLRRDTLRTLPTYFYLCFPDCFLTWLLVRRNLKALLHSNYFLCYIPGTLRSIEGCRLSVSPKVSSRLQTGALSSAQNPAALLRLT